MLHPDHRFVALDFETTGLDKNSDEAIQIGIAEIDHTGKIIKEFSSLLKPNKDIKELKNIVGFMTGISISDLENAPTIHSLQHEIEQFFNEKTILIGHNIQFDIDFLLKYLPNITFKNSIDTFVRAQNFIHFAPSYALEVLIEYLANNEYKFQSFLQEYELDKVIAEDNFHGALEDAKSTLALFTYLNKYASELTENYPVIQKILSQNTSIFLDTIPSTIIQKQEDQVRELPPLEKALPATPSMEVENGIDIHSLKNKERYYIGNETFKKTLEKITCNKNIILSFSSRQKLDIAKHHLHNMGLKNIGFAKEEQVINPVILKSFINKQQFSEDEIMFVFKYLSHRYKDIGFLDLNSKKDYDIFFFLKDSKDSHNYPLVLTTHGGLFSVISEQDHSYNNYDICFFDSEQRYKSFNNYLSRPCDLYFTLNYIETLIYAYKTRNQIKTDKYTESVEALQKFYEFFQVFMGTIFADCKKLFTKTDRDKIEYNPIIDDGRFYNTSCLRKQVQDFKNNLKDKLLEKDYQRLFQDIEHIDFILNTMVTINKKMHNQNGEFYFLFKETNKYTNRDEFLELFEERQTIFFSHSNTQYPKVTDSKEMFDTPYQLTAIHKTPQVIEKIEEILQQPEAQSVFILSSKKEESRLIFELLYKKDQHHNANLIAENITGGIGKCIFKCKNNQKNIVIGGYNFLMRMFAKKKDIDIVINFNIKGALEQFFLDDLARYAYKPE